MLRRAGLLSFFLIVFFTAGAFAGLIAYFPFNEGQGTATADATGNGNDGTLSSGVQWATGIKGSGVQFDTAGERIVTTSLNPTANNNAMTLAAWIQWTGQGGSISQQGIVGKREGWDPGTGIKWFWQTNPAGDLLFRCDTAQGGTGLWWGNTRLVPYANEWTHVAVTWDNGTTVQYVNATETDRGTVTLGGAAADATIVSIGCVSATNNETFIGTIDEVRIYDTALTAAGIEVAMTGDTTSASAPQPVAGATDVPRDVLLSWSAGESAGSHDVYLGADAAAVEQASRTDGRGVLASSGQSATSYQPAALLDFGQTYYWRVDEVNAPPSSAVHKGAAWSFTVEPYAYPVTGVTATASSAQTGMGPEKTVDGSGMTGNLHGTEPSSMWLSAGAVPSWIQYDLARVYKLYEMQVWNSNQMIEALLGFGAKKVTVETSLDGTTWTPVADVPEFARAPGSPGYAANTTVNLGVEARYVKLTIESNWGGVAPQSGLSEVRFSYVPVEARSPQPAQFAEAVPVDATLDWRPGREATSHQVTYGTNRAAVADGSATSKTVAQHGLTGGAFDFGTTYYWKVDEVGPATYPGSIWSFTTQQYAPVEDFESYTDEEGNEIFATWIDGFTNGLSNSVVGYFTAKNGTFGETSIVHGGKQSMPFEYNNVKTPYYSEAERTFSPAQDWTVHSATHLSLWLYGSPAPFVQAANGDITMSAAGADIYNQTDEFRYVYKPLTGDGSITARVDRVDNLNDWTKAGVMIRESLEPRVRSAHMIVTPTGRIEFQYRGTMGGNTTGINTNPGSATLPFWVRITRTGNTLTGEYSADGKTWQKLTVAPDTSSTTLVMPTAYIGLAVTSHVAGQTAVAQFSNITTTGGVSGAWKVADVGVAQGGNGADDVYLSLTDSAGKSATVRYPGGTNVNGWTQWQIPLSDFTAAGVKVSAIKKMVLGVGNRANPKPDGAGMLYFDDIGFGKPILPVGLVASYSFENNVDDSSGNGHHGTILGTPTYVDGPAGKGKALLFPGTPGSAVDLGTFNPSEKTGMLSVSLWAKWNGLSTQWQGLIGKRNNWNTTDTMWQIEANQTSGVLSLGRYNISVGSGNQVLKVGEWTHIAVTFDKTTARFYVNGTQTGSGVFSFGPAREASLLIGCDNAGGGNPFSGALDEVKLYDVVLTPAEVLALAGK
jgi:hypothetical protein